MRQSTPALVSVILLALVFALFWGWPKYRVYTMEMRGKAAYAEAEQNRRIAALDAAAEVERARGVAEANRIIGQSLQGNESYLRYLWIQNLNTGSGERIYIPTEAGLPILEARTPEAGD